jgi:hypothetical protein
LSEIQIKKKLIMPLSVHFGQYEHLVKVKGKVVPELNLLSTTP